MANFNCKNCGAPLSTDGTKDFVTCEYCNTLQAVPEEFKTKKENKRHQTPVIDEGTRKISKVMSIVIIIITVVVFIGIITGIGFMISDIKKSEEEMDKWNAQFEEDFNDAQEFIDKQQQEIEKEFN